MESRLTYMFKKEEDYEVLVKMQGKDLKGKGYKPLFPYFQHMKESGAFRKFKLKIKKMFLRYWELAEVPGVSVGTHSYPAL